MHQIRVKILPGIGSSEGKWEVVEFEEFILRYSPSLAMHVNFTKQFPPLHILNEELRSGGQDQGMSGGCFWKPFEISKSDYLKIREEMLTNPVYDLGYDEHLESKTKLSKWCGAVLSHHNPRKIRKT